MGKNRFVPQESATRAQVAAILMNFIQNPGSHADAADLFEIVPAVPYTAAYRNYSTDCRAKREQNDSSAHPAIAATCKVEITADYDVVFLGYPIWWCQAPKIIYTFLETYDFSEKTIIPFCTSGGSSVGSSAANLEQLTSGATWLDGYRLNGDDSQDTVMEWVNSLGLDFGQ